MIKAIETRYAGCRFRSRLEARWAVFFDHAGISWEYEPEGFDIDGRYYLPDFRLPGCGTWIEVKGEMPDQDTLDFLAKAAWELPQDRSGKEPGPRLMLVGPIPELHPHRRDIAWRDMQGGTAGFGNFYRNGRPWWLGWELDRQHLHGFDDTEHMDLEISEAYRAARAARFEHGENG